MTPPLMPPTTFFERGLPSSEITLAEILRDNGYRTLHIGKWHLGRTQGMWPHDQGFDESLMMASALYQPIDDPDVVNATLPFSSIDRFLWPGLATRFSTTGATGSSRRAT